MVKIKAKESYLREICFVFLMAGGSLFFVLPSSTIRSIYPVAILLNQILGPLLCVFSAMSLGRSFLWLNGFVFPPILSILFSLILGAFFLSTLASVLVVFNLWSYWTIPVTILIPIIFLSSFFYLVMVDFRKIFLMGEVTTKMPAFSGEWLEANNFLWKETRKGLIFLAVIFLVFTQIKNNYIGENLYLAIKGFWGSLISVISALILGRKLLPLFNLKVPYCLKLLVEAGVGVCVFTGIAVVLTLMNLAYPWLISFLGISPLVFYKTLPGITKDLRRTFQSWWGGSREQKVIVLLITPFIGYSFLACLVSPYMSDALSYHLVIPRNILIDSSYIYNPFAYQAGMVSSWHIFGLYAFALGGDRGYTCLEAWAFVGIIQFIFMIIRVRYSRDMGLFVVCIATLILSSIVHINARSGTDIPMTLVEGLVLLIVSSWTRGKLLNRSIFLGVLIGFFVSIKLIAIVPSFLAGVFLLATLKRQDWFKYSMVIILSASIFGGISPAVNFLNTGSPFPPQSLIMSPPSFPLPQFGDTVTHDNKNYVEYFASKQVFDQFWGSILGDEDLIKNAKIFYIILLGFFPLVLWIKNFRRDNFVRLLFIYASLSFFLLGFSPILRFIFRYHLSFFLIMGIIAGLGLWHMLWVMDFKKRRSAILAIVALFLTMWFIPSLKEGTRFYIQDFNRPVGARTAHIETFDWISENLPLKSVIAGTGIMTYHSNRKYLEMQAISQQEIDLSLPPRELLSRVKTHGATHIHLTTALDTPVWNDDLANKWLRNFRAISELPDVKLIYSNESVSNRFYGRSSEEVYEIK